MSLAASCENLYFPAEQFDNVVALKWNTNDTPLEPNTSVIFKVKSTAPQLFHVVPRYGAILLADATGATVQNSSKATAITFGLREHHTGAEGEGGAGNKNGAGGAAPSTPSRVSTARTSRAASAAPNGGPAYQERFAVEYVMIKSEPLAFQQIFNSLTDHSKLTEVVKNMWSLVASGAIPRAHLGVQASINMKVFMVNVVMKQSDPAPVGGDETTKIVVPPEARLVSTNGQGRVSVHNQSTATSRRVSEAASTANSTPSSSRRKAVDELRALKEEINLMRRDSGAFPSSHASPSTANTPSSQRTADPRRLTDSLSPPHKSAASAAALPAVMDEDVIMKFDYGVGVNADGKPKKKGLKVYLVLMIMFTLYVLLLSMRRGATHNMKAVAVVPETGKEVDNATANAFAVQVSSRELEKS